MRKSDHSPFLGSIQLRAELLFLLRGLLGCGLLLLRRHSADHLLPFEIQGRDRDVVAPRVRDPIYRSVPSCQDGDSKKRSLDVFIRRSWDASGASRQHTNRLLQATRATRRWSERVPGHAMRADGARASQRRRSVQALEGEGALASAIIMIASRKSEGAPRGRPFVNLDWIYWRLLLFLGGFLRGLLRLLLGCHCSPTTSFLRSRS